MFNGRRQPSCGGTSRMMREYQVRICERLGVKFPGPTRPVPTVFVAVSEPVSQGIVASLAHPGGNLTGFTNLEATFGAKWLELLKEIAPRVAPSTRASGCLWPSASNPERSDQHQLIVDMQAVDLDH